MLTSPVSHRADFHKYERRMEIIDKILEGIDQQIATAETKRDNARETYLDIKEDIWYEEYKCQWALVDALVKQRAEVLAQKISELQKDRQAERIGVHTALLAQSQPRLRYNFALKRFAHKYINVNMQPNLRCSIYHVAWLDL